MSFQRWCLRPQSLSHVLLFATPWTVAYQAPLSMGFPWQEYWSGLPFPTPGDLPKPGIEPTSLTSPALEGGFFTLCYLGKPFQRWYLLLNDMMSFQGSTDPSVKDNFLCLCICNHEQILLSCNSKIGQPYIVYLVVLQQLKYSSLYFLLVICL